LTFVFLSFSFHLHDGVAKRKPASQDLVEINNRGDQVDVNTSFRREDVLSTIINHEEVVLEVSDSGREEVGGIGIGFVEGLGKCRPDGGSNPFPWLRLPRGNIFHVLSSELERKILDRLDMDQIKEEVGVTLAQHGDILHRRVVPPQEKHIVGNFTKGKEMAILKEGKPILGWRGQHLSLRSAEDLGGMAIQIDGMFSFDHSKTKRNRKDANSINI